MTRRRLIPFPDRTKACRGYDRLQNPGTLPFRPSTSITAPSKWYCSFRRANDEVAMPKTILILRARSQRKLTWPFRGTRICCCEESRRRWDHHTPIIARVTGQTGQRSSVLGRRDCAEQGIWEQGCRRRRKPRFTSSTISIAVASTRPGKRSPANPDGTTDPFDPLQSRPVPVAF